MRQYMFDYLIHMIHLPSHNTLSFIYLLHLNFLIDTPLFLFLQLLNLYLSYSVPTMPLFSLSDCT